MAENSDTGYRNVSVFYLLDIGDKAIGLKLIVDCIHASYLGVLHHIIHDKNKIYLWLEQASLLKSGHKFWHLIKVNYYDILNIQIVGMDTKARKNILLQFQINPKSHPLLMKRVSPLEPVEEDCSEAITTYEDFVKDLKSSCTSIDFEAPNCILVDNFQENFEFAITCIRKEPVIGLCYNGIDVGRLGKLAWIGISTSENLFLIDIAKLGIEDCLNKGLKEILKNKRQCKVIDDSRCLQDYLQHLYDCSLSNIFDVKASDIYLHRVTNGTEMPCILLPSLSSLLHQHLGHNTELLRKYLEITIEDETTWFERPFLNRLKNHVLYSVMFLKELREAMISAMLIGNREITAIFQSSQATKGISLVNQIEKSIVPPELQDLHNKIDCNQPKIAYIKNKRSNK